MKRYGGVSIQRGCALSDEFPRRGGCERRLIDIRRENEHTVIGWLEDDFHHFGVKIVHEGGRVADISTIASRYPYTTCADAGHPLSKVIGMPLSLRATDIGAWIDMRLQCTHLFDLAGLLVAHAAAGRQRRRYEALVNDREVIATDVNQRRTLGAGGAKLLQDGVAVLSWQIDRQMITGPSEWTGQSLQTGFRERTEAMDVEAAEHATVLRRTVMIAGGRSASRGNYPLPRERSIPAVCHTFQPDQKEKALWISKSERNWEKSSDGMLGHIDIIP